MGQARCGLGADGEEPGLAEAQPGNLQPAFCIRVLGVLGGLGVSGFWGFGGSVRTLNP